ncbi:histidine phosphatase family protein [Mycobacterium sp. KBS0706]|uniref:histidine phosphatase family protein n=1 Tax=Mycobacterium sp. KBS0706 TaxID=2578109 RepID=UPI00110FE7B4|nr:histidine phosphatase family protein [Mycobacterium sp. KBS0706]TSD88953.1 histidine phosphatase family protein [Mycobacterium sp. KBS0706]
MTRLLVLRHAPTDWNAGRRLQGRADIPLSEAGRAAAAQWRLPDWTAGWQALASPLSRAQETARLLGLDPVPEPALTELDWGGWEGLRLSDKTRIDPDELARREALGLDFRAPDGESYRELQARLAPLLLRLAAAGRDTVAVCHRGVILALYACAADWTMIGEAPDGLQWGCAHLFRLDDSGAPVIERLNIVLAA